MKKRRAAAPLVAVAAMLATSASAQPGGPVGTLVFVRGHRPSPAFNYGDLMTANIATASQRVILRNRWVYGPRWSPDGRRIAFTGDPRSVKGRCCYSTLFVLNLATHRLRRVLRSASSLSWSPDGKRLAASSSLRGRNGLIVADPAGRIRPRLIVRTSAALSPEWSPDGSRIAYVRADSTHTCCEIHVVGRDGRRDHRVSAAPLEQVDFPTWSPDGRLISYGVYTGEDLGLYVVAPDGHGLRRVTKTIGDRPAWSPNGSWLAIAAAAPGGRGGLVLVAPDGTGEHVLVTDRATGPAWSPDGQRIAYAADDEDGTTHLYVVGADGDGRIQLTHGRVRDALPQWRPRRP